MDSKYYFRALTPFIAIQIFRMQYGIWNSLFGSMYIIDASAATLEGIVIGSICSICFTFGVG